MSVNNHTLFWVIFTEIDYIVQHPAVIKLFILCLMVTMLIHRVLFPGGGAHLNSSGYGNVGEVVFKLATQVGGICTMYFQLIFFKMSGRVKFTVASVSEFGVSYVCCS